ncbi:MAG TPA: hypothetical protein PLV45_05610 [bacterium]|nr:hypothetical protein [bacterium]
MKQASILVILAAGVLLPAVVLAAIHTETFTDYSGYDPFQSTARWNPSHQRMEIHPIQTGGMMFSGAVTADTSGGYFVLTAQPVGENLGMCLQRLNSNGDPLIPSGGIILLEMTGFEVFDAVTLSTGDLLITWSESATSGVYVQRYTPGGTPVWPAPVKINHTPPGDYVRDIAASALPGNEAVIVFCDDRSGISKAYIQRITGTGNPVWSSEKQLQTALPGAQQYDLSVVTDSTGRIFASWTQNDGDYNIAVTRVSLDGTIDWDPAVIVNRDTSSSHVNHSASLREGDGVYFSWMSTDGLNYFLDLQKINFDGSCDYAADYTLITHETGFNHQSVRVLPSGNLLVTFSMIVDYQNVLATVVLDPDFTPFAPPSTLVEPTTLEHVTSCRVGVSPSGGAMVIWTAVGEYLSHLYAMNVGNLGQPLWPARRTLETQPDDIVYFGLGFTKNSGLDGGFKMHWVDNRNHALHGFGCRFESPVQPSMVPRQLESEIRALGVRSSQAPDGTVAVAWVARTEDGMDIKVMWCTRNFSPMWSEPVLIRDGDFESALTNMAIDIDALGRAVITWTQSGGPDIGTYLQVVTPDRQRVHPTPVRVNSGILAGYFYDSCINANPDGSVTVTWSDTTLGDENLWAQRILSDGSLAWASSFRITPVAPSYFIGMDLIRAADQNCVIYAIHDGTQYVIYRAMFNDSGTFTEFPQPISNGYEYCSIPAAATLGNDVYVVWGGMDGGYVQIYGQKLVDGTPVWIDRLFSATSYSDVSRLDLISTGSNRLAYAFLAYQGVNEYVLSQEFNTNGTTSYSSEQRMFSSEPKVYTLEYGVSAQINSGEPVYWAAVNTTADARGGSIVSWLSNDGGGTWHPAQPGLPVVFPAPGNDLRWGVDLYADYYQQQSPYLTSVTTSWNESAVASDLVLNQDHYTGGDTFRLVLRHSNTGGSTIVDKYILLDVYGMYWYWPGWSETLDFSQDSISSGYTEDVIFDFSWPSGVGEAHDLRFWSALLEPGTANLVGPWDYVTFGYGP